MLTLCRSLRMLLQRDLVRTFPRTGKLARFQACFSGLHTEPTDWSVSLGLVSNRPDIYSSFANYSKPEMETTAERKPKPGSRSVGFKMNEVTGTFKPSLPSNPFKLLSYEERPAALPDDSFSCIQWSDLSAEPTSFERVSDLLPTNPTSAAKEFTEDLADSGKMYCPACQQYVRAHVQLRLGPPSFWRRLCCTLQTSEGQRSWVYSCQRCLFVLAKLSQAKSRG